MSVPHISSAEASDRFLWKGAILPSTVTAIIAVIVSTAVRRSAGLAGALLGSVVVLLFFSVHLLVARISRNLDPLATMALAMFSYFAKVLTMGALLIIVTRTTSPDAVDRTCFGVSALVITVAWLAGEIRAFLRLRFQLPLPPQK